jgi:hypothetical protein
MATSSKKKRAKALRARQGSEAAAATSASTTSPLYRQLFLRIWPLLAAVAAAAARLFAVVASASRRAFAALRALSDRVIASIPPKEFAYNIACFASFSALVATSMAVEAGVAAARAAFQRGNATTAASSIAPSLLTVLLLLAAAHQSFRGARTICMWLMSPALVKDVSAPCTRAAACAAAAAVAAAALLGGIGAGGQEAAAAVTSRAADAATWAATAAGLADLSWALKAGSLTVGPALLSLSGCAIAFDVVSRAALLRAGGGDDESGGSKDDGGRAADSIILTVKVAITVTVAAALAARSAVLRFWASLETPEAPPPLPSEGSSGDAEDEAARLRREERQLKILALVLERQRFAAREWRLQRRREMVGLPAEGGDPDWGGAGDEDGAGDDDDNRGAVVGGGWRKEEGEEGEWQMGFMDEDDEDDDDEDDEDVDASEEEDEEASEEEDDQASSLSSLSSSSSASSASGSSPSASPSPSPSSSSSSDISSGSDSSTSDAQPLNPERLFLVTASSAAAVNRAWRRAAERALDYSAVVLRPTAHELFEASETDDEDDDEDDYDDEEDEGEWQEEDGEPGVANGGGGEGGGDDDGAGEPTPPAGGSSTRSARALAWAKKAAARVAAVAPSVLALVLVAVGALFKASAAVMVVALDATPRPRGLLSLRSHERGVLRAVWIHGTTSAAHRWADLRSYLWTAVWTLRCQPLDAFWARQAKIALSCAARELSSVLAAAKRRSLAAVLPASRGERAAAAEAADALKGVRVLKIDDAVPALAELARLARPAERGRGGGDDPRRQHADLNLLAPDRPTLRPPVSHLFSSVVTLDIGQWPSTWQQRQPQLQGRSSLLLRRCFGLGPPQPPPPSASSLFSRRSLPSLRVLSVRLLAKSN